MPANTKPGIDWSEVAERVSGGESYRSIAKDLTSRGMKISHVSVRKRAIKNGWVTGPKRWLTEAHQTKTAKALANPKTAYDRRILSEGARTPANLAEILRRIEEGLSEHTAVAGIVAWNTWARWKIEDPDIPALVEDALRRQAQDDERSVKNAADRGEWKAAADRLARNPVTKEAWSQKQGGGGINVILNFEGPTSMEEWDRRGKLQGVTPDDKSEGGINSGHRDDC